MYIHLYRRRVKLDGRQKLLCCAETKMDFKIHRIKRRQVGHYVFKINSDITFLSLE